MSTRTVAARDAAHPALSRADLPLALYLHFPWCVRKCPYCDFNSHAGDVPEQAYVEALIRDLDHELASDPESRPLVSIFMGGGTPSLFSGAAISQVLDAVSQRLAFAPDIEITLEANPGTVDEAHFAGYRRAGVNRLSMGVQSMDADKLRRLGRIHDPAAVIRSVETARVAGFDNINLDLMFALPEQTLQQAREDVEKLLALAPEHLSYYQLTLEPNTAFASAPPPLPDDELAWAMQQQGVALLAAAGFDRYEVSAYATAGRQARHNRNYWTFGDYLGIGAGAHAKRSGPGGVVRRARHKHPKKYLASAGSAEAIQEHSVIAAEDLPFEFAMNALRLDEGFSISDFEKRTGLSAAVLRGVLDKLALQQLITESAGRVCTTALGAQHLNQVLTAFL